MIVDFWVQIISWSSTGNLADVLPILDWHYLLNWNLAAPQVSADLGADVQKAWNHFIECGQVWALLVGLVVGWIVKSILP